MKSENFKIRKSLNTETLKLGGHEVQHQETLRVEHVKRKFRKALKEKSGNP